MARGFVTERLDAWGAGDFIEITRLLVSELVANAALHAHTAITVSLTQDDDLLRLEVADLSPRRPILRHYSAEATTGRGLALVDAISQTWGVENRQEGKAVWLELHADHLEQAWDRHLEMAVPEDGIS